MNHYELTRFTWKQEEVQTLFESQAIFDSEARVITAFEPHHSLSMHLLKVKPIDFLRGVLPGVIRVN